MNNILERINGTSINCSNDQNHHDSIHNSNIGKHNFPDSSRIIAAANALKAEFNLSLFGFDVIIPSICNNPINDNIINNDVNELVIIDVNFFPSYKEVWLNTFKNI